MEVDIIIVTYNSEKWLENLINSIENQKGINLRKINLFFVDNVSTDGTIQKLFEYKEKSKLGKFEIIKSDKNLGFGGANNLGFKHGKSKYVFFLNPDTELEENSLCIMLEDISNSSKEFKMWEFRQKPYEHPKWYDILTRETSWASGACFIIEREVFEEIKGFDDKLFMYAEDVDLSWKVRVYGYKIKYVPKATVLHYCYQTANEVKPIQYYYTIINNLNLRLKYGTFKDEFEWYKRFFNILKVQGPQLTSRRNLIKKFIENLKNYLHFKLWKYKKEVRNNLEKFVPTFIGFDYENAREGAFVRNDNIETKPLVSILVRTCGRPLVLRETLISLRNQTYNNIEIVIVEDGKNISEEMIKKEFPDLNILYKATGEKVGRCVVGNMALELANGEYLNFLDDDDLFYADHIETMIQKLMENKEYNAAYTIAYEERRELLSTEPEYKYIIHGKSIVFNKKFSRFTLITRNAFPIQTVMFKKELYEKYGGLDLEFNYLEDWELWARYCFDNKFLYIPKVTSAYRVPDNEELYRDRQKILISYHEKLQQKIFKRVINIKPEEILEEIKYI